MKRQLFILGILINVMFYSCSAVSRTRHVVCKKNDYMHGGRYKLSPWKTIQFKLYFKNSRTATDGNIHIYKSKHVSCTSGVTVRNFISKSCTNWNFSRRKTLQYRMYCK